MLDASPLGQGSVGAVVCVHSDTYEYPTTVMKITTTKGSFNVEVGINENFPVPVLFGRDHPAFHKLWRDAQMRLNQEQ